MTDHVKLLARLKEALEDVVHGAGQIGAQLAVGTVAPGAPAKVAGVTALAMLLADDWNGADALMSDAAGTLQHVMEPDSDSE